MCSFAVPLSTCAAYTLQPPDPQEPPCQGPAVPSFTLRLAAVAELTHTHMTFTTHTQLSLPTPLNSTPNPMAHAAFPFHSSPRQVGLLAQPVAQPVPSRAHQYHPHHHPTIIT